jgi:outer membrane protein OmpA-like peptidoglycan-associated protein
MRCNWRRWLWGVIPLAGISVAAVHLERSTIEKDLTGRAERALAASGGGWADVNFSGRDVVLTGNASVESEPVEAEAVLKKLWGVRYVNNNAGLPPKVEPYVWSARRRGDQVRLSGYAPNRATRQTIIGMTNATLPGLELTDRMKTGRGVPPTDTWLAGLSFALKQLATLKRGEVRFEDLALTISGEAETAEEYRTVTAALKKGLPKGITLAGARIAAPAVSPYTWSAQFAGGQLVLSGHVPSDAAKSELQSAAEAAPAGTGVVERLETARGAPQDFAGAAAALVRHIVKLQSGSAEIKDASATVGGVAADDAQAKAVREGLRAAMPASFKLADQIRVREQPKAEPPKVEPPKVDPPKVETPKIETKPLAEPAQPAPRPFAEPQTKVEAATPPPLQPPPGQQAEAKAPSVSEAPPEPPVVPPASAAVAPPSAASGLEQKVAVAAAVPPAATPAPPPGAVPAPPKEEVPPAPPPAPPVAKVEPPAPAVAPPAASSEQLTVCRDDLTKLVKAAPIAFERGSSKLGAAGTEALDRIAAAVKACPGVRVTAEGHADIEGSPMYNKRLSKKRARAVAAYLIDAGVGSDRVETAGFGSSRPVAPNTTADARAKNRRTEVVVER